MNKKICEIAWFAVALAASGCSSSTPEQKTESNTTPDSGSPTSDAASSDTGASTADAEVSCVPEGHPGNEKGVGAWCSATTRCDTTKAATTCTADFPVAGPHHFCTIVGCTKDEDCGTEAYCNASGGLGACTPSICAGPKDGG